MTTYSFRSSLAACLTFALAAGCGATAEGDANSNLSVEALRQGGVDVLISVDWEGDDLVDAPLAAMVQFRKDHPNIPLVQFLNAAYYTKPQADTASVTEKISSTLLPIDELGLHLHGWKSLFTSAGVAFQSSPSFTGRPTWDCSYDCGHDVPISLYTAAELSRVLSFSVRKLESQGFGRAQSFRAGGWMAGPTVRAALVKQNFLFDHSSVPVSLLAPKMQPLGWPLVGMLNLLWGDTTIESQPRLMAAGSGQLTEIPDNGALADWVSVADMKRTIDSAIATWQADHNSTPVVSIGFHQETADQYLSKINAIVDYLDKKEHEGVVVRYVTSDEAGDSR